MFHEACMFSLLVTSPCLMDIGLLTLIVTVTHVTPLRPDPVQMAPVLKGKLFR